MFPSEPTNTKGNLFPEGTVSPSCTGIKQERPAWPSSAPSLILRVNLLIHSEVKGGGLGV